MSPLLQRASIRSAFATFLFAVVVCRAGNATPLIYNTNQVPPHHSLGVFQTQWVAMAFMTGPSAASLTAITLHEWTIGNPTNSFLMSIYSDLSGAPGSMLPGGALNGPAIPQGFSYQTYSAGAPLTLAANTPYWVVASSGQPNNLNTYSWTFAPTSSYTSSVGCSYPDFY